MYHLSTVDLATYLVLKELFRIDLLKNQFALAGGTSLSLQIGHRHSIDLDIFSNTIFNPKEVEIVLTDNANFNFTYTGNNSRMLFGYVNNIKCDFVQEPATLIQPFTEYDGVNYFHIQDIAAMKMHTICGRGKKKDFFDIYALLQLYSWKKMLEWFGKKYGKTQYYFLWKSISYFEDADAEPDITGIGNFNKSWAEIKTYILNHCTQI
jgi:predicted nucleotidyltransferase component of viral defense system